MKKLLLLTIIILFTVVSASAKIRTASEVQSIAEKHFATKTTMGRSASAKIVKTISASEILTQAQTRSSSVGEAFYVLISSSGANVIVSGDDRMVPVLGYLKNRYDKNQINDGLKDLLSTYCSIYNDIQSSGGTMEQISQSYLTRAFPDAVPSLLDGIFWDQSGPYNWMSPVLSNGMNGYTGCIATATAMVMRYHKYPAIGVGSRNEINFAERPLAWDKMRKTYNKGGETDEEKRAVAWLMRCVGASVDMKYEIGGSGSGSQNIPPALVNYFQYDRGVHLVNRKSQTFAQWVNILKTELSSNRPIVYNSYSTLGFEGHSFVVDGYDKNDLFSVNWGYSGSGDGYFSISGLNGRWNAGHMAVVGIQPPVKDAAYVSHFSASGSGMVISQAEISRNGTFDVKEQWSYTNDGDDFSGSLGLILCQNGTLVTTLGTPFISVVKRGYSFVIQPDPSIPEHTLGVGFKNVSIPSSVVPGRYQIYMATKDQRETSWQIVKLNQEMLPFYDVEITSGKITFSSPVDLSKVKLTEFTVPNKIYFKETASFSMSALNEGSEWSGYFSVRFTSLQTGQTENFADIQTYPLLPGKITPFKFSRMIGYDPGKYKVEFLYSHDAATWIVMPGSERIPYVEVLPENFEKYEYYVIARSANMEKVGLTNKEEKPRLLIELSCVGAKAIKNGNFVVTISGNGMQTIYNQIPVSMEKGETRKFLVEPMSELALADGDGYIMSIFFDYPGGDLGTRPIENMQNSYTFGVRTLQNGK